MHSNEIFLSQKNINGLPSYIIKSSSTKNGIESLRNEIDGIYWYNKQIDTNLKIVIEKECPEYLSTKCNYVPGVIYPYYFGFSKNEISGVLGDNWFNFYKRMN